MNIEVTLTSAGRPYLIPLPPGTDEDVTFDRGVTHYPLDETLFRSQDDWRRFAIESSSNNNGTCWALSQMVVDVMLLLEGHRLHTYFESRAEDAGRISGYDLSSELAARSVDLGELHRLLCAHDGGSPQTCTFFDEFAHWFPFYRITAEEISFCFAKLGPAHELGAERQTKIVLHPWHLGPEVRRLTGSAGDVVYEKSQWKRPEYGYGYSTPRSGGPQCTCWQ